MSRSFLLHLYVTRKEELFAILHIERKARGESPMDIAARKVRQPEYAHLAPFYKEGKMLKEKVQELYEPLVARYIHLAREIDPSGSLEIKILNGFSRALDNTRYPDTSYVKKWLSTVMSRHKKNIYINFSEDRTESNDGDYIHYSSLPEFLDMNSEERWSDEIDYKRLFERIRRRLSKHGRDDLIRVLEKR